MTFVISLEKGAPVAANKYEVTVKFYVEAPNQDAAWLIGEKIAAYIYRVDGIDSDVDAVDRVD